MLSELQVSQFAIIENIHISFKEGLNILSGETGAGKSVLLKSLSLLMGEKASSDMIRTGFNQAVVEGCFDLSKRQDVQAHLEKMGIPVEDECLIVRRVIGLGDKNKIYLNGSLSTLSALREVVTPMIEVAGQTAPLIEMTGQHENRNLLSKAYHLDILDQYVENQNLRAKYDEKYQEFLSLKEEIAKLESSEQASAQRLDFLKYQRQEIADLDMAPGEENELEFQIKRLKNAGRIMQFAESTETALFEDNDAISTRIHNLLHKAAELAHVDSQLLEKLKPLETAKSLIDEAGFELGKYVKNLDVDPSSLEEMEQKLSRFRKLQKKYGTSVAEILTALVQIENEIHRLENFDATLAELKKKTAKIQLELKEMAVKLHQKRSQGADKLSTQVNEELLDLNMKGVTFHVRVGEVLELGPTGISDVEFMTKSSPKDPERPLAKVASGGELSRILLSLKRVVGTAGFPRTYLFDEVDTGVSGPTAEKVGKKLRAIASIAQGQQVICVTHLPQVAACGDTHYVIHKSTEDGGVSMLVSELSDRERIKEIARLISGEKISKTSLAHAEQLLKAAPH